ncbi:hypothetical protein L208DRAFT_1511446 [Tricholoma matsutake]|nr:hypothetical protein L208DRAFT_1511446 [Tricholoma matsutake 945]
MMTFKKLVTSIYMMQNRWAGLDWLRILLMTRALSITKKMIYLCKMYCSDSVDKFRGNFHYKAKA